MLNRATESGTCIYSRCHHYRMTIRLIKHMNMLGQKDQILVSSSISYNVFLLWHLTLNII